jgi:hypothetical protein
VENTPKILRAKAAMARRLEAGTIDPNVAARLLRFAKKCEEHADRLERETSPTR